MSLYYISNGRSSFLKRRGKFFLKNGTPSVGGFSGLTGLTAGGFLSLTAFQAEGCGLPLCGNAYEVSVTGFTFSVIWHEKHSADWLAALASPYPARRTSPAVRSVNRKEGPFMGRLRAYFDRLAHPMQDVHRGRIKHRETLSS